MLSRNIIELLAPAKNVECGRAAIDHGADAVYIGAPMFGARHAAANTVEDIAELVRYAHTFGVRVHVALNTLLFDKEVPQARKLAWELYRVGVDVLIVQDMALLCGDMPPIELHASTQCDNRSVEKILFWQNLGLRQAVLARELSIAEIRNIAGQSSIRLEAFVHGALCVSYSGQCYMSLCDGGRSANRGECAQPCRLKYSLVAADGTPLVKGARHLLSLKDNNQSDNIEALIDAGVSSFKIEGRLKDASYVSNVTLFYRRLIDEILSRRPDLKRLSQGHVETSLQPDLYKSFNRGFTSYFAHGRQSDIWQPATPKSLGEPLGQVAAVSPKGFEVVSLKELHNGDGLCYISRDGRFGGLKADVVERVVPSRKSQAGNRKNGEGDNGDIRWRVLTKDSRGLVVGTMLYRNADVAFEAELKRDKSVRYLDADLSLDFDGDMFSLSITDEGGGASVFIRALTSDMAQNPEASHGHMVRTLGKLGGTALRASSVSVSAAAAARFVPAAELNALRRDAVVAHMELCIQRNSPQASSRTEKPGTLFVTDKLDRDSNVINQEARAFMEAHGASLVEWGHDRLADHAGARVMTTRHCFLKSLGKCMREHPARGILPMTLTSENGRVFVVSCNCQKCQMEIALPAKRQ